MMDNLIRILKLKKINGELDNLSEQESAFISLFDDMKVKYKKHNFWDGATMDVLYFYKETYVSGNCVHVHYFKYYSDSRELWCDHSKLKFIFEDIFYAKINIKQLLCNKFGFKIDIMLYTNDY